ncbi:MAG: TRAP transporter large permease subunit [Proteobacteria bacterium]|nr:TRAP transporter large permease subunit [Pseudomonadota bacterium]
MARLNKSHQKAESGFERGDRTNEKEWFRNTGDFLRLPDSGRERPGAVIFGHFLAVTRIPFEIAGRVEQMPLPPYAIIGLIYLIGGCFIDTLALVMLTIPMFYPIITGLGYDPIWFGVIIVLVTQMGGITPPVGLNVYVVSGIAPQVPLEQIFKGALPFLAALILGTAVLAAWPRLVLRLPNLIFGG